MKDPKGRLTLKAAAYNFILQDRVTSTGALAKEDWQILWQLKIQHWLKLVLWKVIVKALSIRGKLRFGQVGDEGAGLCPLFGGAEELVVHLFLDCPRAKFLWRQGP